MNYGNEVLSDNIRRIKGQLIKNLFTAIILLVILVILIFIGTTFPNYSKTSENQIELGENIEDILISEQGDKVYIKLTGEDNKEKITKIKFVFTSDKEYYYEINPSAENVSVPLKKDFRGWLSDKFKKYDYEISAEEVGLSDFRNIEKISVNFEYEKDIVEESTGTSLLSTQQSTPIIRQDKGSLGQNSRSSNNSLLTLTSKIISPESIIPKPQKIEMLSGSAVSIDSTWKILADLKDEYENFSAFYLQNKTFEKTGIKLEVLDIDNIPSISNKIIIGNPNKISKIREIANREYININFALKKGFNQGYILQIKPNEILILANSTTGTFYGTISLIWLLKQDGNSIILPHTKITDWPDLKIRGFYGTSENKEVWDPYTATRRGPYYSKKEEWIENLAKYKYNLWTKGPLDKFALQRHFFLTTQLNPLNLRNIYDENLGVYKGGLHEGIWAYNISFKFNSSGYAEPIDDEFLLNNPDFEIDADGDKIPDNWEFSNKNYPGEWTWDCTEAHSGSCSVKFTLSEPIGIISSALFKTKTPYHLAPNRTYIFRFWAKKIDSNNHDRQPQFTLVMMKNELNDFKIDKNPVYYNKEIDDNSGEWKQYNLMFTTYNAEFFRIYSRVMNCEPVEIWLDDFELIDVTNKLRNVIKTPSTQLEVWNKQRTVKYREGEDYRIHEIGDFNFKNPLEGKKTFIERIEGGKIAPESEVKVDYDFIVNFQKTRDEYVTLSDPSLYYFYENGSGWIKETMEKEYKPEYVFIGMDEITGFNRDSRGKKRGLKNYQLLAEFLNEIIDIIHRYNPNAKVLLWDDMLSPFHNGGKEEYQMMYGGQPGKSWYALDLLKRENVILIPWWYSVKDYYKKMRNSPILYNRFGFKYIVGTWYNETNIRWWSYLAYKYNATGMLNHEFYNNVDSLGTVANYSWNTVKTNPGIEICDGVDNDGDNIYWITSSSNYLWNTNIDESFNLVSDPFNCGSCGNICYYPHAFASCVNGICQFDGCFDGYYNLDGNLDNGCEYFTQCGNGGIDINSNEECDRDTLFGETCVSLGFFGGELSCTSDCKFDTSNCWTESVCGNGIVQGDEQCDLNNIPTTCKALGYAGGTLSCKDCKFDTSGCTEFETFFKFAKIINFFKSLLTKKTENAITGEFIVESNRSIS